MIIVLVPSIVALVGVLMYALATNPKLADIGRVAFGAGLLVTLLEVSGAIRIVT